MGWSYEQMGADYSFSLQLQYAREAEARKVAEGRARQAELDAMARAESARNDAHVLKCRKILRSHGIDPESLNLAQMMAAYAGELPAFMASEQSAEAEGLRRLVALTAVV